MTIAVLCYDSAEVDIIRDAPNFKTDEQTENWLIEHCGYDPYHIYWMSGKIKINELTPESFG